MAKGPRASRQRRGLRKLPPALIAQAQDQTAVTISRIMLTFVGLALFCLLSLLTPDVALLTGGERLNVPFAGPVSFLGFMIIGPLVLIALRILLQIYVEHWRRLEPIRRRLPGSWVPIVAPLQHPLLRGFAGLVLYLLLPLTMLAFTWKAAVLPAWGLGLLCLTVAVIAGHLMLPLGWRWRWKALLSGSAGILVAAMVAYGEWPVSRRANLFRADLSNHWLPDSHLQGADLRRANVAHANLDYSDLAGANLEAANLASADLNYVNLAGARLVAAQLEGTRLSRANLVGANLNDANLKGADLTGADLENANLKHSDLAGADLSSAFHFVPRRPPRGMRLAGANLKGADLDYANLAGANLSDVSLEGASLEGANLRAADLTDAQGLTQAKLDQACADETTKRSKDLSIRPCAQ